MVKRKTPAYVKKIKARNKKLLDENAERELFFKDAPIFEDMFRGMYEEAMRQQRHLLAHAALERPSKVYERAQAVKGGNGQWHCSKCLKGCYYDGRCGDGPILMCECNAAEDRQYDNERR